MRGLWDDIKTAITGVSDARESVSGRIHLTDGEGMARIHDYALVPLPDGQTMISFADVTFAVRMEEALAERNAALTAAERLKNAFIEHVSIAFRAPLTSIKGFSEILASKVFGPLNDKQVEYVADVESSANVLTALVDNLLDMAVLEAGRMELDTAPVDVSQIIADASATVADQLRARDIHLAIDPVEGDTMITADGSRLHQVVVNLVSNAINASDRGATVHIQQTAGDNWIEVAVQDNGPGVPENQREAIFKRFEGGRMTGANQSGGAGLGLAITRSLVDLHHGTVELDAAYTDGARFVVRLPRGVVVKSEKSAEVPNRSVSAAAS